MTENYLCSHCRDWLKLNQAEIPNRCLDSYKLAATHYHSGNFDTAIQSIGSVFEMAKIMLESNSFSNQYASDWLLTSSEGLVRILNDAGRNNDSAFIHRKTVSLIGKVSKGIEMNKVTSILANIGSLVEEHRVPLRIVH